MKQNRIEINVVAFKEDGLWVAQCVEYDIAARASTIAILLKAFEREFAANLCVNIDMGRNGLEGIPAAPEEIRALFEASPAKLEPRGSKNRNTDSAFRVRDWRLADAIAA